MDPEAMRFVGGRAVPRADAPAVVERWLEQWRVNGIGHFVVERQEDRRVLGRVGFAVWNRSTWRQATFLEAAEHGLPELGWALARTHWGRGYATEAAFAARVWGRREASVRRLISLIASENAASQRVAQRLGAQPGRTVRLADAGSAVVWEHPADSG